MKIKPKNEETLDNMTLARDIPFDSCFSHSPSSEPVFCRVKVTGFLLNSTVISDIINRGDIIVHNLHKGTICGFRGNTPVVKRAVTVTFDEF